MSNTLLILFLIAGALVLASLVLGILNMGREGEEARRMSNKLMRARVILQAIAIALVVLAMAVR